jgi:16S rRNA (adenine1518-N6/adenine1519-N6)-dimethyltransferase
VLALLRDALRVRTLGVNKIVASIPYQITSPILHECVNLSLFIDTVALVIQKEVAERITAKIPDTNYFAVFLDAFFEVNLVRIIEREAFDPAPNVDSAIVLLKRKSEPLISHGQIPEFSKFLHHGFLQQRKMLNKRFDLELLNKANIEPTRRAETLSIQEWILLFNFLKKD